MTRYARDLAWRFVGDTTLAQRFIPQARVVLGVLRDTLQFGVTTGAQTRTIERGLVEIRAEFIDGRPRCTIDVTRLAEDRQQKLLPGIVTIPHNVIYPDGVDPADPEAILIPVKDSNVALWLTLWHDTSIPVWSATPRPRGLFQQVFPDGVHHGGEVDWRGPDGVHLSWYGPQSRYWLDPREQAINTFPVPYLFHLGVIFLFTDQYAVNVDDPDLAGGIMGAAIYRNPDDGAVFLHTVQKIGTTCRIIRYGLARDPAATGNVRAQITSHAILWTQEMPDSRCPFFFNQSGNAIVHMTDPFNGSFTFPAVGTQAPTSCEIWRIAIAEGGDVSADTETVTYLATGEGGVNVTTPAVVALDFRDDVEVSVKVLRMAKDSLNNPDTRRPFNVSDEMYSDVVRCAGAMEIDGRYFSLQYGTRIPGNTGRYTWDKIIHVDLRYGVVLSLQAVRPSFDTTEGRRSEVTLWRDGVKVAGFAGANDIKSAAGDGFVHWEPGAGTAPLPATVSPRLLANGFYNEPYFDDIGISSIPRGFLCTCSQGSAYWPAVFSSDAAEFDINGRFWSFGLAFEQGRIATSGASFFGPTDGSGGIAGTANFLTGSTLAARTGVTDPPSADYDELGSASYYPMFALGAPIF